MKTRKAFLRTTCSALALLAATACLTAPSSVLAQNTPLPDPIPGLIPASPIKVALRSIATTNLVSPLAAALMPGDQHHMYVVDQVGKVWKVGIKGRHVGEKPRLFLDVSNLLVPLMTEFDERGLLGLAFHPDFKKNGLFYTFTSQPATRTADFSTLPPGVPPNCQSVITEWRVKDPGKRDSRVDPRSARELMRIDKPQFNHNGGALAFGPDRKLYISLGDGGAADDEGVGHAPTGNGQSLAAGNVLGKILRIDPRGHNSTNGKYGIPFDNPFIGREGADEIFAYGFRNPFRMSFDPLGRLLVGDVGQNDIEEVDIVVSGGNYGWRIKEGTFLFDTGGPNGDGFVFANSPGVPAGLIDPIAEYDHRDAAGGPIVREAIIGGFVYRGKEIKPLRGRYVFGDYTGEELNSGHMFVLGDLDEVQELIARNRNPLRLSVLGFAEDQAGELYLLANSTGSPSGMTGKVLKLVKPGKGD